MKAQCHSHPVFQVNLIGILYKKWWCSDNGIPVFKTVAQPFYIAFILLYIDGLAVIMWLAMLNSVILMFGVVHTLERRLLILNCYLQTSA